MDPTAEWPKTDQADRADRADQLIDGIIGTCLNYHIGTRPTHAPGIVATGWFRGSTVAESLTSAIHFSGRQVPVTVRFSNGTGDIDQPDSVLAVRGMATKFHIGDAHIDGSGRIHSPVESDLLAMSLPEFMGSTVEDFSEFLKAATPRVPVRRSIWRRILGALRLEMPYPNPASRAPSIDQGMYDFGVRHPRACPALASLKTMFSPAAYTTCSYHAVHTFGLEGRHGIRWARLHWEPVDGVQAAPPEATGNFLREGLAARVQAGHADFELRAQLAEAGDDLDDPARPLPLRRPRIVMGHLRLTDVPCDQRLDGELSFNPARLVPGIVRSSHDEIFAVRGEVYDRSYARRMAARQPAPRQPARPS